jgi:16S rRNA processing protein RimM
VAVGRLGRPHGVVGEIRLDTMNGLPRGLEGYSRLFLGDGRTVRPVTLAGWRFSDRWLLLTVQGVGDRDEVAALTGQTLYVLREELPPLEEGEYYHADLLGSTVEDEAGRELGTVADVQSLGDYDMLTIRAGARLWFLPVLGEYVLDIDAASSRIRVRVPEGLGP